MGTLKGSGEGGEGFVVVGECGGFAEAFDFAAGKFGGGIFPTGRKSRYYLGLATQGVGIMVEKMAMDVEE